MLKVVTFVRDLKRLVDTANAIRAEAAKTGQPAFSLAFTNRSFVVQVVAMLLLLAAPLGFVLPIPPEMLVEFIVTAVSLAAGLLSWSGFERLTGVTRAVWNRTQGIKAVQEAAAVAADGDPDKLSIALTRALALAEDRPAMQRAIRKAEK